MVHATYEITKLLSTRTGLKLPVASAFCLLRRTVQCPFIFSAPLPSLCDETHRLACLVSYKGDADDIGSEQPIDGIYYMGDAVHFHWDGFNDYREGFDVFYGTVLLKQVMIEHTDKHPEGKVVELNRVSLSVMPHGRMKHRWWIGEEVEAL